MAQDPRARPAALTSLPRLDDIPQLPGGGYDEARVREAFDSFRRHVLHGGGASQTWRNSCRARRW